MDIKKTYKRFCTENGLLDTYEISLPYVEMAYNTVIDMEKEIHNFNSFFLFCHRHYLLWAYDFSINIMRNWHEWDNWSLEI